MGKTISLKKGSKLRLGIVFTLVVTGLFFQPMHTQSKEDLQSKARLKRDEYLQKDSLIQSNFVKMKEIIKDIRREQITSILSDLVLKNDLDETTGTESISKYELIIRDLRDQLQTRETTGYKIDLTSENELSKVQYTVIGGYDVDDPIITRGDTGILGLFIAYEETLVENVTEVRNRPGTNETIEVEYALFLPDLYLQNVNEIRIRHNNDIDEVLGYDPNSSVEGIQSIIQFNLNKALELNNGSGHTNESEIETAFNRQGSEISEYFSIISEFENLYLVSSNISQVVINDKKDNVGEDLKSRQDSIEVFHRKILELTSNLDLEILSIQRIINIGFSNIHNRILEALEQNIKIFGQLLSDGEEMISKVNQSLKEEQKQFNFQFDSLIQGLKDDTESETSSMPILLILPILLLASVMYISRKRDLMG